MRRLINLPRKRQGLGMPLATVFVLALSGCSPPPSANGPGLTTGGFGVATYGQRIFVPSAE